MGPSMASQETTSSDQNCLPAASNSPCLHKVVKAFAKALPEILEVRERYLET